MKDVYKLGLRYENLTNRSVLSQAWKKVNLFVRRDSWYTDYLELDNVSLDLERNLTNWSQIDLIKQMLDSNVKKIRVPKSAKWEINDSDDKNLNNKFNIWKSSRVFDEGNLVELSTRPISNISIESQVFAMSVLMNLAEIVEQRQKRIVSNSLSANKNGLFSYGNRLACYWELSENGYEPYFKTGSVQIYEKYFKSYELFIKRPDEICSYYYDGLDLYKELYIVSLDLKTFYDSIDLTVLYQKIHNLINLNINDTEINTFQNAIKNILSWVEDGKEFKGLPQGLAASGFFANVYLIDFDEAIGSVIGSNLSKVFSSDNSSNIMLRDYCRYVDDLRFVVEVNRNISKKEIQAAIEKFVKKVVSTYYNEDSIELNEQKSNVIAYKESINNSISQELTQKRALISGTPSVDELMENIDALKNVFISHANIENGKETNGNDEFGLLSIYQPSINLKEGTIKRFVATDLKKSFKVKDSFNVTDKSQDNIGRFNMPTVNREKDNIARLLVSAWLKDPSLIYLLKCALEIHASANLIKPVLDIILVKIENYEIMIKGESSQEELNTITSEYHSVLYIASQILFYSATKIYTQQEDTYNINRIKEYKESITCFAEKIINIHFGEEDRKRSIPWYTLQGAIFFLVSNNRKVSNLILNLDEKLIKYESLYIVSEYELPNITPKNAKSILMVALVNQQMKPDKEKFSSWFKKLLYEIEEKNYTEIILDIIHLLFIYDKELFEYVYKTNHYLCRYTKEEYGNQYEKYFEVSKGKHFELRNNQEISFLKVILSNINPFIYENALLLLLDNLVKSENGKYLKNGVSLHDITVKCNDWSQIQNPNYYGNKDFFAIKFTEKKFSEKPKRTNLLEEFPFWLKDQKNFKLWWDNEISGNLDLRESDLWESVDKKIKQNWNFEFDSYNNERKIMYSIGKILRSSLIGDYDYTLTKYSQNIQNRGYKGIIGTTFSRSFGLNTSSNALTEGEQSITPWFLEIIFNSLRWPYAYRAPHKNGFFTLKRIFKEVKEKINMQRSIYGSMSKLPIYIQPVENLKLMEKESVRIASVQTMMPLVEDFDAKNPLYWSTSYRNKHRKHIINLCHLIYKHLESQNVDDTEDLKVDLIVFPELSIHIDDLDILENLAKQTNASIFTGLTYVENPYISGEFINRAVWLLNESNDDGVSITKVFQGKLNVTSGEERWDISGYRPYQIIIDFKLKNNTSWKVSGAICYDATDLKLAADLKDITDTFIIAAMNRDIQTFDNMATALSYHMYQPVIIVNTGEFGGSTVQAPYSGHNKLIAHLHGGKQLGLSIFDISPTDFKKIKEGKMSKKRKTPPAGYQGRQQ